MELGQNEEFFCVTPSAIVSQNPVRPQGQRSTPIHPGPPDSEPGFAQLSDLSDPFAQVPTMAYTQWAENVNLWVARSPVGRYFRLEHSGHVGLDAARKSM